MKTFFLLFVLCSGAFFPAIINANPEGSITLESVDGQTGIGLIGDGLITFNLRVTVAPASDTVSLLSNGFRVYSPDGATWSGLVGDTISGWNSYYDLNGISYFSADGVGADTVGFFGVAFLGTGLPPNYDNVPITVSITVDIADTGKTICIDSSFFGVGGEWLWSTIDDSTGVPSWSGPHCFTVSSCPTTPDPDGDGFAGPCDNCPDSSNAGQEDLDSDGVGDVCDNCPDAVNSGQENSDSDSLGNACDNCPTVSNQLQEDSDADGKGDSCDIANMDFVGAPTSGDVPLDVVFTDLSIAADSITEWKWYFGDGDSSMIQNPSHNFIVPGIYSISLIVSNGILADTLLKPNYITVNDTVLGGQFTIVESQEADIMYLTLGDLDYDNKIDLIFSPSGIFGVDSYIAYGTGNGDFETPVLIAPGFATNFALGFVNTDTLLDVISASQNIHILLNNGDRTFSTSSFFNSSVILSALATGYFNSDPFLDIVVSPKTVYFGNGTGSFPTSNTLPFGVSEEISAVEVSDFNLDGKDDLVVTITDSVVILINDGNGNFTQTSSTYLGDIVLSVSTGNALADFNNDGNPDFVLISPQLSSALVLVGLGDGAGGLAAIDSFRIDGNAHTLVTTDFNRDFELDIIVSDPTNNSLEFYIGDGLGHFDFAGSIDLSEEVGINLALGTADLNRDGNPDFVTGSYLSKSSIVSVISNLPDREVVADEMVTTAFSTVTMNIIDPDGFEISRNRNTAGGSYYWRLDKDNDGSLDDQAYDYNLIYGEYRLIFYPKPDSGIGDKFSAAIRINGTQQLIIFADYSNSGTSKNGAVSDSLVFFITIDSVSAITPASGETVSENTPVFYWSNLVSAKQSQVDTYHFQLDPYLDFRAPYYNDSSLANPQFTVPTPLGRDSLYYWRVRTFDGTIYSNWSREFAVYIGPFFCGDVNNDETSNEILDLTYLVDFIFRGGPLPPILANADLNGDGTPADILDLTFLVDFIFRGGSLPTCGI